MRPVRGHIFTATETRRVTKSIRFGVHYHYYYYYLRQNYVRRTDEIVLFIYLHREMSSVDGYFVSISVWSDRTRLTPRLLSKSFHRRRNTARAEDMSLSLSLYSHNAAFPSTITMIETIRETISTIRIYIYILDNIYICTLKLVPRRVKRLNACTRPDGPVDQSTRLFINRFSG